MLLAASSSIYRIHPLDIELIDNGQLTSLRCQLETSDDFRLQYVTWFKISRDDETQREFVYHYDRCTGDDQAYGSLAGRARVTVTSHPSVSVVSQPKRQYVLCNTRLIYTMMNISAMMMMMMIRGVQRHPRRRKMRHRNPRGGGQK